MQLHSSCVPVMGEACHCCNIRRLGGCSSLGMHPIVVAVAFPWLEIGIESLGEGAGVRSGTCCD